MSDSYTNFPNGITSFGWRFDQDISSGSSPTFNTVKFTTTPTGTLEEGDVRWNEDDKTLEIKTNTDAVLQVGQEFFLRATNKTGVQIDNGSLVYISGAQGNRPTVALAQADAEPTSAGTIAFATHDVPDNTTGFFTHIGLVRGLDTDSFSEGDLLYLSPDTAGAWTNTKPNSPNHLVVVGVIITSSATEGVIFAKIDNGFETTELHDVDNTTPSVTGQLLVWNNSNSRYELNTRATVELDNLGTTAINADLIPSSDNTRDIGTSAKKFKETYSVDVTFEDPNGADFTATDLARHQLETFNELSTLEFNTTAATAAGVRTVTATQPDSEKHEFIIGSKRLEQSVQAALTKVHTGLNGTDASPNKVYTYVQNDGADAPEMTASNTEPDGVVVHADVVYEVVGSIAGSTANVYATNNVQPVIHDVLEKLLDRIKEQGSLYKTGMDITATSTRFAITSGTALHVINEATIPALDINSAAAVDTQFTIEDDDTYTTYDDFQLDEYYDGVAVANTHRVKCRIGVVINNPELTSARFHIVPQLGAQVYNTDASAWYDAKGMAKTIPRVDIVKHAFVPIADIVIKNTTGTFTLVAHPDSGLYYNDVRGE
jgi:hypothetical protein